LVRLGVAEQDERVIAEIPANEPLVATGGLRYAALKAANRLAQVFKAHTVTPRRWADQFAAQGGDLAAFGFRTTDRCGVSWGIVARWRCCGAILLSGRQAQPRQIKLAVLGVSQDARIRHHDRADGTQPRDYLARVVQTSQMSVAGGEKATRLRKAWILLGSET